MSQYDPVYSHQYYEQHRNLKGRKSGKATAAVGAGFTTAKLAKKPSPNSLSAIKLPNGKTIHLNAAQLAVAKTHVAQRITQLKSHLSQLQHKLQTEKAKANVAKKGKQPPTQSQKNKAAQKAKQYRQSHKQQLANKAKAKSSSGPKKAPSVPAKSTSNPVASLTKQIAQTQGALDAATRLQQTLAAASKNG